MTVAEGGNGVNPVATVLTRRGRDRYDDVVTSTAKSGARTARCPHCKVETPWHGNTHRPFCSLACRLIDLGDWLDERYRVAGAPVPDHSGDDDAVTGRE